MARLLELDDDDGILGQCGDKGSTHARFSYYPACPRPDLVLGVSPHNDVCVLTLLLADEHVGGLQFQRDGTWYCVPPVHGRALLVNVGVSLEVRSQPSPLRFLHFVAVYVQTDSDELVLGRRTLVTGRCR
jgi:isopenicillin N synthase-like dioxygenase